MKKATMHYTLNAESSALKDLYDAYNKGLFGGALPACVITVQRDGGLKALGYFTPWEAWKTVDGQDVACEIALTAENLNRPAIELAATLLHECVHACNFVKGVKDTSRHGAFHNSKFKATAEAAGLIVEADEKYGWKTTGFIEGSMSFKIAATWSNKHSAAGTFEKHRIELTNSRPTKKPVKRTTYVCPCCESKITSGSAALHIRCMDCNMDFIRKD